MIIFLAISQVPLCLFQKLTGSMEPVEPVLTTALQQHLMMARLREAKLMRKVDKYLKRFQGLLHKQICTCTCTNPTNPQIPTLIGQTPRDSSIGLILVRHLTAREVVNLSSETINHMHKNMLFRNRFTNLATTQHSFARLNRMAITGKRAMEPIQVRAYGKWDNHIAYIITRNSILLS